jgi:peptidylprolyl isomerase
MAALFMITAVAFSAFVIYDMTQSKKRKQAEAELAGAQTQQSKCDIGQPVPGVETLPTPEPYTTTEPVSSLQVVPVSEGSGQEAKQGDCLVMKYYGTLAKDGTMFDENFSKDQALQFSLGTGQVIPGWDNGLVGAKVGETRRLVIPAAQAYGERATGSIPANSDLVFVVKLVEIKKQ